MGKSRAPMGIGAVFVVATVLPYAAGLAGQGSDRVFLGILQNVPDNANVLAQIAQSVEDGWLYRNPYVPGSPEIYANPLYAILGTLGRATGAGPLLLFHLARVAAAAALALLVVQLGRRLAPGAPAVATALVLFGTGIGPLLTEVDARLHPLPLAAADLRSQLPEATTYWTCLIHAHLAVALLLLVATHALAIQALTAATPGRPAAFAAAGLHALLAFTHPFDVAGVVATVVAFVGVGLLRAEASRALLRAALPIVAAPLPAVAYYLWLSAAHPDLANAAHFSQYSKAPLVHLAFLGVTLPVAIAALVSGGAQGAQGTGRERRYLAAWLLAQLAATLGRPVVPFERRLAMGLMVPAGILAAGGLGELARRGGWRRALAWLLVALAVAGSPILAARKVSALSRGKGPELVSRGAWQALGVLARHAAPGELVVDQAGLDLHLPWLRAGRPFVGYGPLMPGKMAREKMVQRFFARDEDDRARTSFLKEQCIAWVVDVGATRPELVAKDYLEIDLDVRGCRLYRVRRDRLGPGGSGAGGAGTSP